MAGHLRAVRLSGIDIGTNTVLLLVAEVSGPGVVTPIAEVQEIPRLGKELDATGRIRKDAFDRLAGIIGTYGAIARTHGSERTAACGTSALRNSANGLDLVEYVRGKTGIAIEVIDGATEADLTFRGALSRSGGKAPASAPDPGNAAVLDIGGGSTEVCFVPPGAPPGAMKTARISMEIGSVRLTERFFRHSPPRPGEIELAKAGILEQFATIGPPGFGAYTLVAVAGTAVALAGIHLDLPGFDRERIDGCTIGSKAVREMAGRLLSMTPGEIRLLSELTAGREDILPAGALILSCFADYFGFNEIVVSTRGLRYGIVLREWDTMNRGSAAGS